jgi:hypothetical protein
LVYLLVLLIPNSYTIICKIKTNYMRQNAGLFTQHVSVTSMPIFRSTIVSTAFWCPNLENRLGFVALGCSMCVLLRGCDPTGKRLTWNVYKDSIRTAQ